MNANRISLLAALPIALTLLPGDADSAAYDRNFNFAASAFCDVNNPGLDASVRRKPTELRNIGATTISITCTVVTDQQLGNTPQNTGVWLRNNLATSGTASCTINSGTAYDSQTTVKKSVPLGAGQTGTATFDSDEYGDFKHFSFHCTLPAGWSVLQTWLYSTEDVGL